MKWWLEKWKKLSSKIPIKFPLKTANYSDWIFDSRPPDFSTIKNNPYYISQSFYGLKIELTSSQFDREVYHMMDFRVTQQKSTQFIYILPYDQHTGLVELTFWEVTDSKKRKQKNIE